MRRGPPWSTVPTSEQVSASPRALSILGRGSLRLSTDSISQRPVKPPQSPLAALRRVSKDSPGTHHWAHSPAYSPTPCAPHARLQPQGLCTCCSAHWKYFSLCSPPGGLCLLLQVPAHAWGSPPPLGSLCFLLRTLVARSRLRVPRAGQASGLVYPPPCPAPSTEPGTGKGRPRGSVQKTRVSACVSA